MNARALMLGFGALAILACGGATPPSHPTTEPSAPVPRLPDPPDIRSRPKAGQEVDEAVIRALRGVDPLIRRCLYDRRPEIRRAREPAAISADIRVSRVDGVVAAEVVRSGFGAPEVVDACILEPLMQVNAEGLSFDVVWHVLADFP